MHCSNSNNSIYHSFIHRKGVREPMKIICSKSDLLTGVNIVLKAVPVKTTMTVLECILIDTSDGVIKLTATDMDMGIETVIEGDIIEGGHIALNAKLFSEIVRKLPDSQVTLETDESCKALITCEKAKFNIAGRSGDDFAALPVVEKTNAYSISQFSLKEIIRQTIFSTADNDANPIFSGELFEFSDNTLKVVALDGQRIAIRKIELKDSFESARVIVPGKTLSEVARILPGEIDKDVNMYITPLHMLFEFENTIVVTRLIEGEYFQVERMISSDYSSKAQVNKRNLQDCIERASLLVRESDRRPTIMGISEGVMELIMQSQIGTMNEEIDISREGKDIEIGFNPRFMLDVLRVIDDEEISIYLVNPRSPFSIRSDDGTYTYVILPISFNSGI